MTAIHGFEDMGKDSFLALSLAGTRRIAIQQGDGTGAERGIDSEYSH
jgi:hypothetical protein